MKNDTHIRIFSKYTISELSWPRTHWGQFAKGLLLPMIENGIGHYVRNIQAELYVMTLGQKIFPLSVLSASYENSLIASPYTHYLEFTAHELRSLNSGLKRTVFGLGLRMMQPVFKGCQFNRVVLINGWPLTTTFYPELSLDEIGAIRDFLVRRFPDHAIIFRTIDDLLGEDFKHLFRQQRFRLIYHRPTYSINPCGPNALPTAALRRDLNKLKKTDYQLLATDQLEERDIDRITELYHKLYIKKHTPYNPQYTKEFFRLIWREKLMELTALKKEGRIDGFIAYYGNDKQLTDPFLGYDVDLPKALGIYRMLSALVYLKAKEKKVILNYSAGVGHFKKRRGCRLTIEYLAVDDRHLNRRRRLPWAVLNACNHLAIPLMTTVDF